MKVLHTSDWHIGKRLAGRERLEEQVAALEEIENICERESVELVLIAGDIFDTFLPPAEAEDLFYRAVKKIAGENRCVVLISGNHDDNIRLGAATALSEELGIYIFGNAGRVPKLYPGRKVCATEAGTNHLVIRNAAGEEIFINVLPYPNEARLKEDKNPDESFIEKMQRWMETGQKENVRSLPSIFLSHLFIAGGKVSEGERQIDLGGARAVPLGALPACDYTALGHLHKRQQFKNNVIYSGSILQYSFDEAGTEKSVTVFNIDKGGVRDLRKIPLKSGKQLVRLSANGMQDALSLVKKYPDCYIELTMYLSEPLLTAQVRELKEANEGILILFPKVQGSGESADVLSLRQLPASELFKTYYKSIYSEEPSDDLTELFLSLTEHADET